ncbi:hypothetical protein ACE1OC_31960 [Streptomyces sp. DSM 116496]
MEHPVARAAMQTKAAAWVLNGVPFVIVVLVSAASSARPGPVPRSVFSL